VLARRVVVASAGLLGKSNERLRIIDLQPSPPMGGTVADTST
jgi:hypothetical protein